MNRFGQSPRAAWLAALFIIAASLLNLPAYACQSSGQVRNIDVLIVLYTRSFSHTLSREQLERVHEEVLEFIEFYRRSAGSAVEFRVSLLQIDRELALSDVSQIAPGRYYLSREDIESELTSLGMLDYDFDEVIALYAWNNANPAGAALAYGGGAVGPDGNFLGDAGYNSIGVFAWDPGRISQIMIHEVLHNIDDMFSMSGMTDAFLNSDEMSRNMATLVVERSGAFLPHYDDDEMTSYAERERANRATYPWSMQLVYYGWMLERTAGEDWLKLGYGQLVDTVRTAGSRPLYDRIFISRANRELYFPISAGDAARPPTVQVRDGRVQPRRRAYHHTDFDGSVLFDGIYYSSWLDLPRDAGRLTVMVDGARAEIIPLGMGAMQAPARVVTSTGSSDRESRDVAYEGKLLVDVCEARFAGGGPLVAEARLKVTGGEDELAVEMIGPGQFALALDAFETGVHRLTMVAETPGVVFAPRLVEVERRHAWRIRADSQLVASNGAPFAVTVRVSRDAGASGARVTARLASREVRLAELEDGRYSVVFEEGMLPGLDTIRVRAELPGADPGDVLETMIPVFFEARGWIEVPARIEARADEPLVLEVHLRDRMGRVVKGADLRVAAVVGDQLLMLKERQGSGLYRLTVTLPAGDHRIYVIGLDGRYERRVVSLQVR